MTIIIWGELAGGCIGGRVRLRTKATMEYDGMTRFELTLSRRRQRLSIAWPW